MSELAQNFIDYDRGQPWRVMIKDCPSNGKPIAVFYDRRHVRERWPEGQPASYYYVETLIDSGDEDSIWTSYQPLSWFSLDGGVPSWSLSGSCCREIGAWLESVAVKV
ncbi:MAG: hypothetical protein ACKVG1_14315 [Rhodospirillales bacterium]